MVPPSYTYSPARAVNGSSVRGNCQVTVNLFGIITSCNNPASSVLFDGHIPTLTGLDGDMWASQLLTVPGVLELRFPINQNFVDIARAEVVMFNCPEWGIGVETIGDGENFRSVQPSLTSCDSLVRVCIPLTTNPGSRYTLELRAPNWAHIAEVTFYTTSDGAPTCPPDAIITNTSTEAPDTAPTTIVPLSTTQLLDTTYSTELQEKVPLTTFTGK